MITAREIEFTSGAPFLIPVTKEIMRMLGFPAHLASAGIDRGASSSIS
jgi:formate--tetrahydrofolate ligase